MLAWTFMQGKSQSVLNDYGKVRELDFANQMHLRPINRQGTFRPPNGYALFSYDRQYTFRFRGNTVVNVQPRSAPLGSYPMYLREAMTGDKAPMKTKKRFVSSIVLPW
ncbi:MAG: hypothetical protein ACC645_14455 [Pirellulales bacterium]